MSTTFRSYDPDQAVLFPSSPSEWLREGHLAFFVSDTVDALDLTAFYAPYEGDGRRNRPFSPQMMLKVMIYSYCTGTFSSRKIGRRLYEDVALRYLAAENFPSHRTICDFRKNHLADFKNVFLQVLAIGREAGLISLGTVAIDGTKIKANASKHKAMSYGRMVKAEEKLQQEIQHLLDKARKADDEEDGAFGEDDDGDGIPEELRRRETRLEKIREAKKALEEQQAERDRAKGRSDNDGRKSTRGGPDFKRDFGVPDDKKQRNFTDPQSRIMKTSSGFEQCYNAQIAVDADNQLIVAQHVTQSPTDVNQLLPLLEKTEENTGSKPDKALADAGYKSEENFQALRDEGIEAYVSLGRGEKASKKSTAASQPATEAMAEALATDEGRSIYKKRKAIVEPPFAWIKQWMAFRAFSLRGIANVCGEWNLVALAANIRRMSKLMQPKTA